MKQIEQLKQWIQESKNIVFFGGAGVSTESGIPDFRSVDGLYRQTFDYPPEKIISHTFFENDPAYFFRFYRDKMMPIGFAPNITHKVLARLETEGRIKAIVTQNIDGLHQKAGSQRVLELHGSIYRNYCVKCGKSFDAQYVKDSDSIPRCDCGGIVKPDVVLYEEQLNADVLDQSIAAIKSADMLIVGGTSLTVYPAAGLVNYYNGNRRVLINKDVTTFDNRADLVIHEALGNVFANI